MRSSTLEVLGLAALVSAFGCRTRSEAPARVCPAPRAEDAGLPGVSLGLVAGTPGEAWAMGSLYQNEQFVGQALLRWDGCDWQRTPFPSAGERIDRISALSANGRDVWLSGFRAGYTEGNEIFHHDGRISRVGGGRLYCRDFALFRRHDERWEEIPKREPTAGHPFAIAGNDAGDVWMLAGGCLALHSRPADVKLVHWTGAVLETVDVSATIGTPLSIWVAGDRSAWLGASGGVGRWDGGAWTWYPFKADDGASYLAGADASDLWAFGKVARHWDGSRWSKPIPPATATSQYREPVFTWAGAVARGRTFAIDSGGGIYRADGARLELIARTRPWSETTGVTSRSWIPFAAAGDELWLFDPGTAERPVVRWKAGRWELGPTQLAAFSTDDVVALWNDGAGGLWAALSGRVALGSRAGELRRFDGRAWVKAADLDGFPSRFWGTAPDDVWLVGLDGHSWHFDGKAWSGRATGAREHLLAVWGAARDDVWAGGTSGTLLNWNGREWRRWSALTMNEVLAVKAMGGAGRDDAWIVGAVGRPCAYHWNGSGFSAPQRGDPTITGGDCYVSDVWVGDRTNAWLLGAEYHNEDEYGKRRIPLPIILSWNGDTWTRAPVAQAVLGDKLLTAIAGADASDVWAVGPEGRVLHWDGKVWSRVEVSTEEDLSAVTVQRGGAVWVGGGRGTLLRVR